MKIVISIENENAFSAGWLACHLGMPKDCVQLTGMFLEAWNEGYEMRQETADMEAADELGHGGCHIAFLIEAQRPVGFVRHKRSAEVFPEL